MDERIPWLFRVARRIARREIKGAAALLGLCRSLWPQASSVLSVPPDRTLRVPLYSPYWVYGLETYEWRMLSAIENELREMGDVTFLDCGADVGAISALLCSKAPQVSRVIAFEPSQSVAPLLSENVRQLPRGEVVNAAVADFSGFGKLVSPAYDRTDHARFLEPSEAGFPVVTLDSFGCSGNICIKLDLEGGEPAALRGARETIRNATRCVMSVEMHPLVFRRTGLTVARMVELLREIRPFRLYVAETGHLPVDPLRQLTNLIAVSE